MSGLARVVVALAFIASALAPAAAEEMPTIRIEMKDGAITPLRIEVPANKPFKLEIHNTGKTPGEFESTELNREKVVAPQSQSFIVFRRLSPGEYVYFDDFHPEAPKGTLIAK
ncbi:MAG TPA: cupredoxin domain-containing protein [Alphaproteobacteria bacterium]|nr:cupredoxin domain-containing protein [Alphaproteobacteria bacterium]